MLDCFVRLSVCAWVCACGGGVCTIGRGWQVLEVCGLGRMCPSLACLTRKACFGVTRGIR